MRTIILLLLFTSVTTAFSQQLQAIHGSAYAGSMAPDYNPAGILNAPYKWDLTILGVQGKTMSNAFYIEPYSLLSAADSVYAVSKNGNFRRYAHTAATVNLMNFRYQINEVSAFSLGANIRSYNHVRSSPVNWHDSMLYVYEFAAQNQPTTSLYAATQSSGWLELKMGYARVLSQTYAGRWQGGVQLKFMRSLSGAHGRLSNINFEPRTSPNPFVPYDFALTAADARYGYSNNYDRTNNDQSAGTNIKQFLKGMSNSVGLDLGVEYIHYWESDALYLEKPPAPHDYNWKFSAALLDIGRNTYTYGKASAHASGAKDGTYASSLQNKFNDLENINQLSDTIKSIAARYDTLRGNFSINQPTRLLINFDKNLEKNFYVNAELQWSIRSIDNVGQLNTKELTTFAITPRWEKKELGVYLPVQYTLERSAWVGLALKAGPLLVGLHNLGWLLGKKSVPNGGGYVTLQIRPGNKKEKDAPCPDY
ncbi:hypothetical protein [Filimonas effusa]|uniref:DUF5723 domain-containing protein n=1 Tax=Filimonas effusa TaxID=2508721 RepID=A0A4Q1D393_9BACT|nr:hypothetical protein [Filimonas effusa]RXK81882.1 hypothetical protein ESB13_19040 [Filimonas effusa]